MKRYVTNPRPGATLPAITDRALRYRAERNPPPGPRVCHYCGSDRFIEIEHIDGREENSNPANLIWACRSCNTQKGAYFAREGVGRKTRQYNPSGAGGARTLRRWLNAVLSIHGAGGTLTPDQAIRVIQATPPAKRTEFARELAAAKAVTLARRNPEETGTHGPVFRQFYHDAAGAVAMLKAMKTGEAVAALYHPAVGDIDMVWGKSGKRGYGLAHILDYSGRAPIVGNLQPLLLGMRRAPHHSEDEVKLSDGRHVALVSLVWQPRGQSRQSKTWLLTAFYDKRAPSAGGRTDVSSNPVAGTSGTPPPGGAKPSAGRYLDVPGAHAAGRPTPPPGGSKPSAGRCLDVAGAHAAGRQTPPPGGSLFIVDQPPRRNNPEPSYEQYLWAVSNHTRGAHDEGGAVIHATGKEARREYARQIAEARRRHGTQRLTGRRSGAEDVPF